MSIVKSVRFLHQFHPYCKSKKRKGGETRENIGRLERDSVFQESEFVRKAHGGGTSGGRLENEGDRRK